MPVPRQFTLGKKERLKSRKAIDGIFKGQRFTALPFRVFFRFAPKEFQVGVTVPGRNFRKAVERNKIKRLMREAWRLQNTELKTLLQQNNQGMQVFIIYTGIEIPEFSLVKDKMNVVIKKLTSAVNEKGPSIT